MKIIEFFLKQTKLINLILVIILLAGINLFINGKKEAFPGFTVNEVLINIVYVGASAKTVENVITYPVENAIKNISGVDKVESTSRENISTIVATINQRYENKLNDIKNDIKNEIDLVDLPEGAEDPDILIFDEGLIPVVRVLVAGGKDEWEIRKVASLIERDILNIKGVGGVSKRGFRSEEIKVECNPHKLKNSGLAIADVMAAISRKNVNVPGGEIFSKNKEYLIRIRGAFSTVKEIENIVITSNEDFVPVRVKDVARVYRGFEKAEIFTRANGRKGIELSIKKNKEGDNIKVSDAITELIKEYKVKYPDVECVVYNDTAIYVKNRLNVLGNNAFIGLAFLVLVLLIFFDLKTSFWTVIGMPVSFCTAIIVANFMDISLNLMSMFGFIIVIGMVVDDAIVIAENIYSKIEQGLEPLKASILGTREVVLPIFVSITTTIVAFFPLLLISGIIGKFFSVIPKVVALTLVASFVEAIFVLPGHLYHSGLKAGTSRKAKIFDGLKNRYEKFLSRLLKHKLITIACFIIFFVLVVSIIAVRVPFKFSPGRVDEYSISLRMNPGYSLETSEGVVRKVEAFLMKSKEEGVVQDVITTVGQIDVGRFVSTGENLARMQVILNPERPASFDEIEFKNKISNHGEGIEGLEEIDVQTLQAGPPPRKAISVIVTGEEFDDVYASAIEIREYVSTLPNTANVKLDYEEGKPEYVVDIDEVKTAAVQLSPLEIAGAIRNAFSGGVATSIKEKGEDINVRVKYDAVTSATYKTLKYLKVKNRFNKYINFDKIAEIKEKKGLSEIRHYNSMITITVLGNLDNAYDKKYTSTYLNGEIKKKFGKKMPGNPDIKIIYGGEDEEINQTLKDMGIAYFLAILFIIILLVGLFKNYSQIFIILFSVPFGLMGVYLGLFVSNMAMSYTSIIGMIALSGVVVNDAIIMIDRINRLRKDGKEVLTAVIEGAVSRFRPVILTTITTMVGIIPMAYGFGGREEFLQPLGVAIVWGIMFATVLTLLLIPVLYMVFEHQIKEVLPARIKNFINKPGIRTSK